MSYTAKNFEHLMGMEGLSDELLQNHFGLYEGYVANTNKLLDIFENARKEVKMSTPEFAELKRRFGWEFNGLRLHEYYFENLSKGGFPLNEKSGLHDKMVEDFGSHADWEEDFRNTGAIRGVGWVILYYDVIGNKLMNVWINEHDGGHLSGAVPILIMDVFEHAYMVDYGTKRVGYIETFFKNIDWQMVEARFNKVQGE